jgi:hypothetical protein
MIKKVSEITTSEIADYIRLGNDYDDVEFETYLNIAKNYISNYTGIPIEGKETEETLDTYPDFIIVVYILCQDMYDNRTLYVDKGTLSYPVETILGMHSINLL